MSVLAAIYATINPLFGTPHTVELGSYARTDEQFEGETVELLEHLRPTLSRDFRVLVVGCGTGAEARWFADEVASVVGIDTNDYSVEATRDLTRGCPNLTCLQVGDQTLPFEDGSFDLIFMHNVCEHLIEIEACFQEYYRVLKPGGRLVNEFAPLFYSPYGAHLQDALCIPWGHLLFGIKTVREIRNRYYPDVDRSTTWAEMGLNRITERRYRKVIARAGFEIEDYTIRNCKGLKGVDRIPLVRNLFILQVNSTLGKPAPSH